MLNFPSAAVAKGPRVYHQRKCHKSWAHPNARERSAIESDIDIQPIETSPDQTGSKTMSGTPRIHVYVHCWNERVILPHLLRHYRFAEKIVVYDNHSDDGSQAIVKAADNTELRFFDSGGEANDQTYRDLKNRVWKESRGKADYVVVCDADEFLYHPNLISLLKTMRKEGGTILKPMGFEMVSDHTPGPGDRLTETVQNGCRSFAFDKCVLFDPNAIDEMNYQIGFHVCLPTGRVSYFRRPNTALLHYKHLSAAYLKDRYQAIRHRLSPFNLKNRFGVQYQQSDERLEAQHCYFQERAQPVVNETNFWREDGDGTIPEPPNDLDQFEHKGMAAMRQQNWDLAVSAFEKVLEFDPVRVTALGNIGAVFHKRKRLDDAQYAVQQALSVDLNRPDLFYNLGNVLSERENVAGATSAFKSALKLKPDFFQAHVNLGNTLRDTRAFDEAAEHYRKALELNPEAWPAYRNLAGVLFKTGQSHKAIDACLLWLRRDPDSLEGLAWLEKSLRQSGDHAAADQALRQLTALQEPTA